MSLNKAKIYNEVDAAIRSGNYNAINLIKDDFNLGDLDLVKFLEDECYNEELFKESQKYFKNNNFKRFLRLFCQYRLVHDKNVSPEDFLLSVHWDNMYSQDDGYYHCNVFAEKSEKWQKRIKYLNEDAYDYYYEFNYDSESESESESESKSEDSWTSWTEDEKKELKQMDFLKTFYCRSL
jgi:hypothetical protein